MAVFPRNGATQVMFPNRSTQKQQMFDWKSPLVSQKKGSCTKIEHCRQLHWAMVSAGFRWWAQAWWKASCVDTESLGRG